MYNNFRDLQLFVVLTMKVSHTLQNDYIILLVITLYYYEIKL